VANIYGVLYKIVFKKIMNNVLMEQKNIYMSKMFHYYVSLKKKYKFYLNIISSVQRKVIFSIISTYMLSMHYKIQNQSIKLYSNLNT